MKLLHTRKATEYMYIHSEKKLIFLAQPRTASKSMAEALGQVGFVDQEARIFASASGLHHLTVAESKLDRSEWTTFSAVRNHWDAVASWICNLGHHLADDALELDWSLGRLREMLDNNPWVHDADSWARGASPDPGEPTRFNGESTLWHRHLPDTDKVIRFETMQKDLDVLLERFGLEMPELSHFEEDSTRCRGGRAYQEFYSDETRDYIGQRFATEIRQLGYVHEEVS